MANSMITMSEETKKFQEAVNSYFDYNKYGYTPEKGYWLLFLLYLVKNNALQVIDTSKISRSNKSKLKVFLCYSFKNIFKDVSNLSDEYKRLATCDCVVINLPDKDTDIQEIADGLGLRLDYNYHKDYLNINLVYTWTKLLQISPLWYKENSWWACNEILKKIDYLICGDKISQPKEITSLVLYLLNSKEGKIYNPYSTFDILQYIQETQKNGANFLFSLQNKNNQQCAIIQLTCLICDLDPNLVTNTDPIIDWRGEIGFDYIISTPPWGVRYKDSEFKTSEIDYFARSTRDVLHTGVGIYPASICYSNRSIEVIKELVENDWLETVILLPKNIFPQTSIESVVIVVNKKKEQKGKVKFVDASKCFIANGNRNILDLEKIFTILSTVESTDGVRIVETTSIKHHGWTIHPNAYTSVDKYTYPEGYQLIELGNILEKYVNQRSFADLNGYLVRTKHLNTSPLDCLEPLKKLEYSSELSNAVKVEEPVILFPTTSGYLPTYCTASPEKPIFVNHGIKIFRIKETAFWVLPEYLCYELSRRITNLRKGLPIDLFNAIFLQLRIAFPTENIEDQKLIVKEAYQQHKLSQAKELGFQELIENMKTEYMNEVRNRKHEMGAYIATLTDIHEDLVNLKVQERYIENQKELNYQCNRFEKALNGLKSLVSIFSDEIEAADVIDLNIDDYFKSLAKEHNSTYEGYDLIYKPDIDINALDFYENSNECENIPLYVEIAKEHFDSLISNIIQNAKRHGFVNRDNNNYKLEIKLSLNTEDLMFQIDFINNGTPLPKGMDKTRYGILGEKAGTTGNTGIGGNRIKNIVKLYNGDYDVFMNNDNTVIRILLPISSKKYEQDA